MAPTDAPITRDARYQTLDVLRGFAVLAIFAVNIKGMAVPFPYYGNASLWFGEYDILIAGLQAFLIEDKWRTIFTGLFGAGLILIAEKTTQSGNKARSRLWWRLFWLLIFGLIHLLFIWAGDILTSYALTGFIAMLFWRNSPKTLWRWMTALLFVALLWVSFMSFGAATIPEVRTEIELMLWGSDPSYLDQSVKTYLAGPLAHFTDRLVSAQGYMISYFLFGGQWLVTLSIMLGGMALWKNGFLKGNLAARTYGRIAIIALMIAYFIDGVRWYFLIQSQWDFGVFMLTGPASILKGMIGGLGYSAIVILAVKSGFQLSPLAAAGRMAFTNYIASSLIGTTLFYGHGGALFGQLTLLELLPVIAGTWLFLILFSMIWLNLFRFGPLEWLWRSLTYRKRQPFRR